MPAAHSTGTPTSDPSPQLTLCLVMDLKRSTATGLKLSTRRLDKFNLALVNQLRPHLEAVGLTEVRMKFTGDGWLLMSNNPDDAAPLCCLAVIMATRFQADIARETGLHPDGVPALRLAVCWARDLEVELPDGQRDFVGDSVRHAVRASQFCGDNEILIDETVQRWIHHDFLTERIDLPARLGAMPDAKWEQDLALHAVRELRVECASEEDAPVYFVNTLTVIGRSGEAEELADRISDRLQSEAGEPDADVLELRDRFNQLLAGSVDYEAAGRILADMEGAGLPPDRETLRTLLLKSGSYATQCVWLQRMKQKGVLPDLATFNAVIRQAPDERTRRKWLAQMKREGIPPDTVTLNTLVAGAPDYASAAGWLARLEAEAVRPDTGSFDLLIQRCEDVTTGMRWIERMFAAGLQPPLVSYLTLFSKDLSGISADALLAWFLRQPYHPAVAMDRPMAAYRRMGRIDDALRLALDYPYTQAARRIMRGNPDRELDRFRQAVEIHPLHPNGAYALGIALLELERRREAEPWLRRAAEVAGPGPRRDEILRLVESLRAPKPSPSHAVVTVPPPAAAVPLG